MSDPSPILAEALEAHRAGHTDQAETLYQQAIDADPGEPTALYLYALMSFEAGRVDLAQELFAKVVALRPEHAEAQATLAHLFHWKGELAAAIAGYRRAAALDETRLDAAVGLANALREAGDAPAAVAAALDAVARFRDTPDARIALAAAKAAADDGAGAAEAYRAAIALAPRAGGPRAALALLLLDAGDAAGALVEGDAAATLAPGGADGWLAMGAALLALHRADAAIPALERAAALAADRAAVHLTLANAYAACDRAADAEARLKTALALEPTLADAHASLSSVYLRARRKPEAERCARRALAIDPANANANANLASLLAEQGQGDEARSLRARAYAGRNLFVEPAPGSALTVLMPTTAEAGNIPLRDLMPADQVSRLRWVIEYATDDQIAALPPFDVVFNAIGDPDLAGPTAAPFRRFLTANARPVLNPPETVARTARDFLPTLMAGIDGVVVPPVARLAGPTIAELGLARAARGAGLSGPVLVRPVGSHGGKGLVLADTDAALDAIDPAGDVYATAYQDFAAADGFYRKYRAIFVDGRAYPYHLAISPNWLVHYESAGMDADAERRAEEQRFLDDPAAALGADAWVAVLAVGQALALDYAGLDFTRLDDGRLLLFEANATMLVHGEAADGVFAGKNAAVQVIAAAFKTMLVRAAGRG